MKSQTLGRIGRIASFFFSAIIIFHVVVLTYYQFILDKIGKKALLESFEQHMPAMVKFVNEDGKWREEVYEENPLFVYGFHVFPALCWAILVPFQFTPFIRKTWTTIHRLMGAIILLCSLSIASTGGLFHHFNLAYSYPTFHSSVFSLGLATIFMPPWFIYTGLRAGKEIVNNRFASHRRFMIRHVALGYRYVNT